MNVIGTVVCGNKVTKKRVHNILDKLTEDELLTLIRNSTRLWEVPHQLKMKIHPIHPSYIEIPADILNMMKQLYATKFFV